MNEIWKTTIFVALAVVVGLVAWLTGPAPLETAAESVHGEPLFRDFTDPRDAASLEIVTFENQKARSLNVLEKDGENLAIASHADYPGDDKTKRRLTEVRKNLTGLKIVGVASAPGLDREDQEEVPDDVREAHNMFGVIDPQGEAKTTDTGVGTRATLWDKDQNVLASLIIGNKVKYQQKQERTPGTQEEEPPGQYYVRRVGKDPVFTVAVDKEHLSTKLEDWVDNEVIDFSLFDLKQMRIRDYTTSEELVQVNPFQVQLVPRVNFNSDMTLDYDSDSDADTKWNLSEYKLADQDGSPVPAQLADDEELDDGKLDDLKSALGWLKFVDVRRKPETLSEELKATGTISTYPSRIDQGSLQEHGFYTEVARDAEGKVVRDAQGNALVEQIISYKGSIQFSLENGVECILRFGKAAGTATPGKEDTSGEKPASKGHDRYLIVTARFRPELIPEPELEPLPEEEKPAEGKTGNAETAKAKTVEEKTAEEKTAAEETSGGQTAQGEETNGKKTDHQAVEKKTDDDQPGEKDEGKDGPEAERERIEKENKRKQEEYQEKIKKGEERVKELNARFADWYYVISNEVYQKIHLSRDQITKKKEKTAEDNDGDETDTHGAPVEEPEQPSSALGDFMKLKQEGPGGTE